MSTTSLRWVLCLFPKNNQFPNSPADTRCQELAQTLEVKGSVLQDCPTWGARHRGDLQATQLQIQGFPWSLSSGSIIHSNNSELSALLMITVYCKGYDSVTDIWKRCMGRDLGQWVCRISMPSYGFDVFTNGVLFQSFYFKFDSVDTLD